MKDYFAEFLLNPKQAVSNTSFSGAIKNFGDNKKIPLKLHIAWALVATGIGMLSWKASKIYAGYKFLKSKS